MELRSLITFGVVMTLTLLSGTAFASPTLARDARGRDVMILQQQLQRIGYMITDLDGEFGDETESAVKEFQRDQELTVTGVVNNATWRALRNAKPNKKNSSKHSDRDFESNDELVPFGKILIDRKKAAAIIETGQKYLGVPYVFGGTTPDGFDCSGFVQYVFKQNGITIPRLADEQYKLGKTVKASDLIPGDLVFFSTYEAGASHCGIYLGDGQFLHTSSSRGVRVDSLDNAYWAPKFLGGKHIVD